MKKTIVYLILLLALSGCMTPYVVKNNSEYVLLNELSLTGKERLKLHWKTTYNSDFAIFDSRSGKFFYKLNYDYSFLKK